MEVPAEGRLVSAWMLVAGYRREQELCKMGYQGAPGMSALENPKIAQAFAPGWWLVTPQHQRRRFAPLRGAKMLELQQGTALTSG